MLSRDADAILIGHMSGRRSEHYFYYQAPYKRGELKAAMDKNHILIVEDDADIRPVVVNIVDHGVHARLPDGEAVAVVLGTL